MHKLTTALEGVADKLGLNRSLLARAQRRYRANRKRAYAAHRRQLDAQRKADEYRGQDGYKIGATKWLDGKALRLSHVAFKNHQRAQFWLGRIKTLTQRIEGLGATQTQYELQRRQLRHVTITGDHATGGSVHERLKAVALKSATECASGRRANFYAQVGAFDAKHCITGPAEDHRDDCSSWFASAYFTAGLADPSGQRYTAGWTGTLVEHGTEIPRPEIGCAVIYGSGSGHHVEMYVGPGNKTIGHGSAPVDAGVIDLFGDGDYRFFKYV